MSVSFQENSCMGMKKVYAWRNPPPLYVTGYSSHTQKSGKLF